MPIAQALESLIVAGRPAALRDLRIGRARGIRPSEVLHQQTLRRASWASECFMTKGHYHATIETGEIYLCLRGRGGMMMKTADGQCRWEEFVPGRLVYAPPYWRTARSTRATSR